MSVNAAPTLLLGFGLEWWCGARVLSLLVRATLSFLSPWSSCVFPASTTELDSWPRIAALAMKECWLCFRSGRTRSWGEDVSWGFEFIRAVSSSYSSGISHQEVQCSVTMESMSSQLLIRGWPNVYESLGVATCRWLLIRLDCCCYRTQTVRQCRWWDVEYEKIESRKKRILNSKVFNSKSSKLRNGWEGEYESQLVVQAAREPQNKVFWRQALRGRVRQGFIH